MRMSKPVGDPPFDADAHAMAPPPPPMQDMPPLPVQPQWVPPAGYILSHILCRCSRAKVSSLGIK